MNTDVWAAGVPFLSALAGALVGVFAAGYLEKREPAERLSPISTFEVRQSRPTPARTRYSGVSCSAKSLM
jgi:hypothetical protein